MSEFEVKTTEAYQCDIYIAGNIITIEETCAEFCERGACVSFTPVTFTYTAGRESGAKVTFIAYARFPKGREKLKSDAEDLAKMLLVRCNQHSCSIVDDRDSIMVTRVLPNVKEK